MTYSLAGATSLLRWQHIVAMRDVKEADYDGPASVYVD